MPGSKPIILLIRNEQSINDVYQWCRPIQEGLVGLSRHLTDENFSTFNLAYIMYRFQFVLQTEETQWDAVAGYTGH